MKTFQMKTINLLTKQPKKKKKKSLWEALGHQSTLHTLANELFYKAKQPMFKTSLIKISPD